MSEVPLADAPPDEIEMVASMAAKLMEHFDSVQIFAARLTPGNTFSTSVINVGEGDFYSRYGYIKEWILKAEEEARIHARDTHEEDI